jgi:hypothetical protein
MCQEKANSFPLKAEAYLIHVASMFTFDLQALIPWLASRCCRGDPAAILSKTQEASGSNRCAACRDTA